MATAATQQPVPVHLNGAHGISELPSDISGKKLAEFPSAVCYIAKNVTTELWNAGDTLGHPGSYGDFNDRQPVTVYDVQNDADFTYDKYGFEWRKSPVDFKHEDWQNREKIEREHYAPMEALILEVTGAKEVKVFNYLTRQASDIGIEPEYREYSETRKQQHQQSYRCHVDQNRPAVGVLLNEHFPPEKAKEILTKHRVAIVNIWRPLRTLYRDPLAVCDLKTVAVEDVVDLKTSQIDGSFATVLAVKHNPKHAWYTKLGMTPDEALIFKQYDSGKGQGPLYGQLPHAAVPNDNWEAEKMYPRESIEVRAFVIYEEEGEDLSDLVDSKWEDYA